MEATKEQDLRNLLINGLPADGLVSPCCFEIFGGAGKHAQGVIVALSKVAHIGHEDDPVVRQLRAAWRTRVYRFHTLALARHRFHLRNMKYHAIMRDIAAAKAGGAPSYSVRRAAEQDHMDAHVKANFLSGPSMSKA